MEGCAVILSSELTIRLLSKSTLFKKSQRFENQRPQKLSTCFIAGLLVPKHKYLSLVIEFAEKAQNHWKLDVVSYVPISKFMTVRKYSQETICGVWIIKRFLFFTTVSFHVSLITIFASMVIHNQALITLPFNAYLFISSTLQSRSYVIIIAQTDHLVENRQYAISAQ